MFENYTLPVLVVLATGLYYIREVYVHSSRDEDLECKDEFPNLDTEDRFLVSKPTLEILNHHELLQLAEVYQIEVNEDMSLEELRTEILDYFE